jgi:Fe-S-cluster-containing dehydrogenase component
MQACPFGVIIVNAEGRGVLKCDLCAERLERGQEPACVAACPSRALVFGEEAAISRNKRRKAAARIIESHQDETPRDKEIQKVPGK